MTEEKKPRYSVSRKGAGGRPKKAKIVNKKLGQLDLYGVAVHFGFHYSRFQALVIADWNLTWKRFDLLYLIYVFGGQKGLTIKKIQELQSILFGAKLMQKFGRDKNSRQGIGKMLRICAELGYLQREEKTYRTQPSLYRLTIRGKNFINIYHKHINRIAKDIQDWQFEHDKYLKKLGDD